MVLGRNNVPAKIFQYDGLRALFSFYVVPASPENWN